MKSILTFFNRLTNPEAPVTGKVRLWFKDNMPYWKGADGVVHSLANIVFGKNVSLSQFEDYITSYTGSNWETYTGGIEMPEGSNGTYLIIGFAMIRMNSTGGDARMRIAVNGGRIGEYMSEELKDSSSGESVPRVLIKKVDLVEGNVIDLDFSTERYGDTITVKEGALILWRLW